MIKFRNYFKSLFSGSPTGGSSFQSVKMLNSFVPYMSNQSGNLYDNNIIRACIHAIASQMAKLTPKVTYGGIPDKRLEDLEYLLSNQPNEHMNRYDFIYKTVSMLYSSNNAFIYTRYENKKISGLYPINYQQIEFIEFENELYSKFKFRNGFEVIIPYDELIHLRRHYNENDLFGSDQTNAVSPILEVIKATNDGMINAVNSTGQLRGVMKYVGNLKETDIAKKTKEFVDSYMSINGNGVGALDSKSDFVPLKIDPVTIDSRQQKLIFDYACMHYNVSEPILRGKYTEDEYNSFYNSVIEPLAIQMSLEFTNKICTKKEVNQGHKISLSADKMTFANNQTRANIINLLRPLGILTANQAMQIMELPTVKEDWADKNIVSLNYVEASKASTYQGVGGDKTDETK